MINLFKKHKIELEKSELEKFELFLKIFQEKNSQINLSAIRKPDEIIEKHFIDSIMLNAFIDLNAHSKKGVCKIADIGTGGGFPGIPLAIINPKIKFTLIDSVQKKIKQVEEFAKQLKLDNIEILSKRAEEIGRNLETRESFDFVVSRATANLPVLLEYTIPLLKVGGVFIAYKLDNKEELKSSKKALSKLGAKIIKVKNYRLADQKRTYIFIEKIKNTPNKYPRKIGIPLKEPL